MPFLRFTTRFLQIFFLLVTCTPVQSEILWLDRTHFLKDDSSVQVNQGGEYHVWIWARDDTAYQISIGNKELNVSTGEKMIDRYTWRQGPTITLPQAVEQSVSVVDTAGESFPPTFARLVLTTEAEFDPDRFGGLFQVFRNAPDRVHDRRCDEVRTLNDFMEFKRANSLDEWQERAEALRRRIRIILGLEPLPEKCPLNPQITGRIERDGYSVEKVAFESHPGFLVTGNLYRPLGKDGPFPAIVSPHGHWGQGRLNDDETGSVPGRCINFARQGCVIFSYDMVGYLDSCQLDHKYGGDAEALWGISLMAIQTWNSIRAIDFVQSLPDVDPDKIGITGASGGGTQTFMLYAVDDRPIVAAPVNMISGRMQGGCLCENAPLLRIHHNNIEIGALFAPKPLMMVSCTGDWTDETPFNEFPNIRSIFTLYEVPDNVGIYYQTAGHNYNQKSREAVYTWFGKWLLGQQDAGDIKEEPFKKETDEDLRVFPKKLEGHPFAQLTAEQFTQERIDECRAWLSRYKTSTAEALDVLRMDLQPQWEEIVGVHVPGKDEIEITRLARERFEKYQINQLIIGREGEGDRIPGVLFIPTQVSEPQPATIVLHPAGKRGLVDFSTGRPRTLVTQLLAGGHRVLAIDCFLTGEYHSPLLATERNREEKLFSTYNYTDTACRVQDILTAVGYLQTRADVSAINIVALDGTGVDAALAAPFVPGLHHLALDFGGYDLSSNEIWRDRFFIPCIRRVGEIQTALTLAAPVTCVVQNATGVNFMSIQSAYRTRNHEERFTVSPEVMSDEALAKWLEG